MNRMEQITAAGAANKFESAKQRLLGLLPVELQNRWQQATLAEIETVIEKRKELGYERVIGYHASKVDLEIGDFLQVDEAG